MNKFTLITYFFLISTTALCNKNIIEISGWIYQKKYLGNQIVDEIIDDASSAKIQTTGGIVGDIFSNGAFLIRLPNSLYKPGNHLQVIITADNYHQSTPEEITINSDESRNKEHKFYLKSNTSDPIIISGIVTDRKSNTPIKNVIVYSKQFDQETFTDENGRYLLKLFIDNSYTFDADIVYRHPFDFYELDSKKVEPLPSRGGASFIVDMELKPKKRVSQLSPIPPIDPTTTQISYSVVCDNAAAPNLRSQQFNKTTVYYLFAPLNDLKKKGILAKEGWFIFKWFNRPRLASDRPNTDLFIPAPKYSLTEVKLSIYEVYYPEDIHPRRDKNSFAIRNGHLYIIDPDLFWRDYNFVVIVVHD